MFDKVCCNCFINIVVYGCLRSISLLCIWGCRYSVVVLLLSPFYLLSFDKSLNMKLQEEQIDMSIRFWDDILTPDFLNDHRQATSWRNFWKPLQTFQQRVCQCFLWMNHIQIGQYTKNRRTFEVARKFPSCLKWALDFMSSKGLSSLGLKLLGGKLKKILKACEGYSMTLQPEEIHILR